MIQKRRADGVTFPINFMVIYEDWIKPTLQSDFRFAESLLKNKNFLDVSTKIVLNTSLPLSFEIDAFSGVREFLDSHNVLFTLFSFDLNKYKSLKTKVVGLYENLTNFSKLFDLLLNIENLFFCEEAVLSSFSSNQKVLDIWYLRVKPLSLSLEDLKKWLIREKEELDREFVAFSESFLPLRIQKIVINRLLKYDDARYYEGGNYLFSICCWSRYCQVIRRPQTVGTCGTINGEYVGAQAHPRSMLFS